MQPAFLNALHQSAATGLGSILLAFGLSIGTAEAETHSYVVAQGSTTAAKQPALSVEQARAAANRILEAVKKRDANTRFSQFSDELKAASSPSMVATSMRTQPELFDWKLLSVQSGLRNTTIEASLNTARGVQELFMVLNEKGELSGYHVDRADEAPSAVARKFVTALSLGHFISARSYLSLDLQKEIGVASLQERWQLLQRKTGSFVAIRKVVEVESTPEQKLLLVNTEFNRLTDSLYVILNANNDITGMDFPSDQIAPKPVR
jgi:hypothetical protein